MKKIKKYVILFSLFARNSFMSQLEYRINFISSVLVETGYFLAKFTYVIVIIRSDLFINGLGPYHITIFIGAYVFMTGVYMLMYPSFLLFPESVRTGSLDLFIIKPVSLQFISSFHRQDYGMVIPNVLAGISLMVYGLVKAGIEFSLSQILYSILFFITGAILTYSLFFLPMVISFWVVRVDKLHATLGSLWDFNNMPMVMYPDWIKRIGVYVIPLFLISNPIAFSLIGNISFSLLLPALIMPFILLGVVKLIWIQGLKGYHSSSL